MATKWRDAVALRGKAALVTGASGGLGVQVARDLAARGCKLVMVTANRTWGAERIRGQLLKLAVRGAKSTIQRYVRGARPPQLPG